MTHTFEKALHKFTDTFDLNLDFEIEFSDKEILQDLTYGRDGRSERMTVPKKQTAQQFVQPPIAPQKLS